LPCGSWSPCTVPRGLLDQSVEPAFPTLKRGANKRCASGALIRTSIMRPSKKACFCYKTDFVKHALRFLLAFVEGEGDLFGADAVAADIDENVFA